MESVNVLIVGAGKISRRHAAAWKGLTCGRVYVADIDPSRAVELAEELGIEAHEDVETALTVDVDVVDVCVPTPFHSQFVLDGLRSGKHVFVEKPLCLTGDEADDIVRVARESGKQVQVGYLFRHHPTYQQVKLWLADGLVGEPHMALVRMGGRGSAAAWKHRRADGGGVVNEMIVHKLDLLIWFFGELALEKVHARYTLMPQRVINGQTHEGDAEDFLLAEMQSGPTKIFLQGDLATPTYMENVEIHGDNGSIVASIVEGFRSYLWLREPKGDWTAGYHYSEPGTVDLFTAELSAFLNDLSREADYGLLEQAARQVHILEELRGW